MANKKTKNSAINCLHSSCDISSCSRCVSCGVVCATVDVLCKAKDGLEVDVVVVSVAVVAIVVLYIDDSDNNDDSTVNCTVCSLDFVEG